MTFREKVEKKKAKVGVVGLGYVGLPLLLEFAEAGFVVFGIDIDLNKVVSLQDGKSYIRHISSEKISRLIRENDKATTSVDFAFANACDALLICVPTPLSDHREPELSYIRSTAELIGPHMREGQLICLESTTYPGTTEDVLIPILEEKSGLKAGLDFMVAYSPEREDPNNKKYSTSTIPKVVGGIDGASLDCARVLYDAVICETVPVSSCRAAEATKLMENIFRSVNIALVNEMKTVLAAMDIDVWEVIEAAKTKPFGYMPFYPGPGLGGHCLKADAMVMMADGTEKPIVDVKVGDYVITHRGRARKVVKTMSHEYDGSLYSIYAQGTHFPLQTTCDHEVYASIWKRDGETDCRVLEEPCMVKSSDLIPHKKRGKCHRLHQHGSCIGGDGGGPELARLLGLYLAKGSVDGRKGCEPKRTRLAFHEDERRLHEDTKKLVKSCFGVESTIRKPHEGKCLVVEINSKKVTAELLRLGHKLSWKKKLAPEVFSWSREALQALWDGWFDGDGTHKGKRHKVVTVSRQLARDMYRIGLMLGMSLSIRTQKIEGKRKAYYIEILKHNYRNGHCRTVNIKRIDREHFGGMVYDLEVEEDHSFVADTFIVSNCIPIDPFYLTWKAREYGMSTRFIELAGEINTAMPRQVALQTMLAANARGMTIRGAKVLIVGLAYKKNTDDDRESPAYALWEQFEQVGAEVSYYDPLCPEVRHSRQNADLCGRKSVSYADVRDFDVAVISTAHDCVDHDVIAELVPLVIDTRNACKLAHNVVKA